jgi:hypothetical protein
VSKNRPYSIDTLASYKEWHAHIVGDPFTKLKMSETEEEDALEFMTRMSLKKLKDGRAMGGTRTFVGVMNFTMMTFNAYQRTHHRWINPFQFIDSLKYAPPERDFLPEDEMIKLFAPGVLKRTMELGVCAAIFLSGLRRAEVLGRQREKRKG